MQGTCQINRDESDKSCVDPALEDSDFGYCLEHEIEFLKWCITANRARIKELKKIKEKQNELNDQTIIYRAS